MIACNNKHQLRQRELQTGKHDGRRSFSPDLLQHEPVGNTLEGLHLVFHDKLIFFISNYDKLIAIGNIPGNRLLKNGMILLDADKLLRIIFPGQRPKPVASSSGQYKTFHMHLAPVSSYECLTGTLPNGHSFHLQLSFPIRFSLWLPAYGTCQRQGSLFLLNVPTDNPLIHYSSHKATG